MSTKTEQLQNIINTYRASGGKWPATTKEMAAWAVSSKLWFPHPSAVVTQCAEELSRALRDEYVTDAQGRKVRSKHAASYGEGQEQTVLWDDIRTASPEHMHRAFQQRRHQILGDCKQLKTDLDSFNENRKPPKLIQIVFDFSLDLEEAKFQRRA
jgi:hypothetical protein